MCSIAEDDYGDEGGVHTMIKDLKSMKLEDEVCKKCSIEKSVIKLDYKDSMCETCFLYYVRHKFRAALGSSKIVKRHSNVLLNFCGHSADVCLLHMIKYAFEQELYKRLYINLKIVFIDEYCTKNYDIKERFGKVQETMDLLKQFPNFSSSYMTIAKINLIDDIKNISMKDMHAIIESEKEFVSTFNSLKSLSAKQDFLEISRKSCLRDVAKQVDCSYVFLSDISIDLAKKLISSIALGRGSSAANDVSFCDDSIDSVKFVRPIKDLNQMEIDHYIKSNNLKTVSASIYGENFGNLASIQNLTSKFIDGLQENYSSTVSTVFKCCNKIAPTNKSHLIATNENFPSTFNDSSNKDINQRCVACKSILDYSSSETLYAVEFSRCVSEVANNIEKLENIRNIQEISINARNGNDNEHNCMKYLCRGCRNIFTEINGEKNISKFL